MLFSVLLLCNILCHVSMHNWHRHMFTHMLLEVCNILLSCIINAELTSSHIYTYASGEVVFIASLWRLHAVTSSDYFVSSSVLLCWWLQTCSKYGTTHSDTNFAIHPMKLSWAPVCCPTYWQAFTHIRMDRNSLGIEVPLTTPSYTNFPVVSTRCPETMLQ